MKDHLADLFLHCDNQACFNNYKRNLVKMILIIGLMRITNDIPKWSQSKNAVIMRNP